jgi:hypothetical protein
MQLYALYRYWFHKKNSCKGAYSRDFKKIVLNNIGDSVSLKHEPLTLLKFFILCFKGYGFRKIHLYYTVYEYRMILVEAYKI